MEQASANRLIEALNHCDHIRVWNPIETSANEVMAFLDLCDHILMEADEMYVSKIPQYLRYKKMFQRVLLLPGLSSHRRQEISFYYQNVMAIILIGEWHVMKNS